MGQVSGYIVNGFMSAKMNNLDLLRKWMKLAYRAGPRSRGISLIVDLKFLGELDLVLRAMEKEIVSLPSPTEFEQRPDFLRSLSNQWVGLAYSTHHLVWTDRCLPEKLASVYEDLRLLRVQLEKHEISTQRVKVADQKPIDMVEFEPDGPGQWSKYYPRDPNRKFTQAAALSYRGSMAWHVVDLRTRTSKWVERQSLADQLLAGWLGET